MKIIALLASLLLPSAALAAGPIIWNGNGSKDLTQDGLLTPAVTLPLGGDVDNATAIVVQAPSSLTSYTLTLPQNDGAAGQCLKTDGAGVTSWEEPLVLPFGTIESFDPNNTSSTRFYIQTNVVPSVPSASANVTEMQLIMDTNLAEDMANLNGLAVNVSAGGDSFAESVQSAYFNTSFGNDVDATSSNYVMGIYSAVQIQEQATTPYIHGMKYDIATDPTSDVADVFGLAGNVNIQEDITGSLTMANLGGSSAGIGGSMSGVSIYTNVTGDVGGSLNGFIYGGNVTGEITNYAKWFGSQGTIGEMNGGAGFNNALNITVNNGNVNGFEDSAVIGTTDGYNAMSLHPSITTNTVNSYGVAYYPSITSTGGATGIAVGGTIGTSSLNVVGFDDSTTVTSATGYLSANFHPTVTAMTEGFTGVNIQPTITGDGDPTDYANGLNIDMSNVSGFTNVQAISANGIVSAQANVPIISAPNPSPVHTFNVGLSSPNGTTLSGIDRFGIGGITQISTGDGSTLSSGPLGLGLASAGWINLVGVGSGSSLTAATGNLVAMVDIGAGGALTDVNAFIAAFATGGGSTTTTNGYHFKTLPAGWTPDDTWGLWDSASEYNWMANSLKIGGSGGSTDRVSSSTIGLEVDEAILSNDPGGNGGNVPHAMNRVSDTTTTSATCSKSCAANERVLGGGCQNSLSSVALATSYPSSDDTWSCEYAAATGDCTAWAICAAY